MSAPVGKAQIGFPRPIARRRFVRTRPFGTLKDPGPPFFPNHRYHPRIPTKARRRSYRSRCQFIRGGKRDRKKRAGVWCHVSLVAKVACGRHFRQMGFSLCHILLLLRTQTLQLSLLPFSLLFFLGRLIDIQYSHLTTNGSTSQNLRRDNCIRTLTFSASPKRRAATNKSSKPPYANTLFFPDIIVRHMIVRGHLPLAFHPPS